MAVVRSHKILKAAGICLLILIVSPFALYSAQFGVAGLLAKDTLDSRFFAVDQALSNGAIFGHMLLGALLTLMIPLQLSGALRRRFPALHRWSGRFLCLCAALTGVGGLVYIAARGTIGGGWMNAGFTLYGVLLILSAVQTMQHARAGRYCEHKRWALRLFVLCMGSWLYRVHYGVWYGLTGGWASTPTFDGWFDLTQNFAFFLPYLVALEVWQRRSKSSLSG